MQLRFVVPNPNSFQSGGNLYNAQLFHAIKEKVVDVQMIDFERFRIEKEEAGNKFYFIDTLYLEEIRGLNSELKNCYLIVHHLESLYPGEGDSAAIFNEKEKPILKRFDGFLTSSGFTKQYLVGKGLTDKQFIVINPALSFQPKLRRKSGSSIKAIIIANLIERKGIYPFLKAIQKSNFLPKNCQIRIAGASKLEPDYAKKCLDLISSDKRLSKIIKYLDSCNSDQVQSLYLKSNLFISTSFMETFGMALQEAVACRLPILAIEGGNTSYHIEDGKNGILFSSISGLLEKLEILVENNTAFKNLLEKAWRFDKFENYSWEEAAELFLKKLNQLVSNRI